MYSSTYFPNRRGGSSGSGTGLTPEQTALLEQLKAWSTDRGDGTLREHLDGVSGLATSAKVASDSLKAWRETVLPAKYAQTGPFTQAASQAEWNKLLQTDQIQANAFVSANPDDTLVTEGPLIAQLYGVQTSIGNVLSIANSKVDTSVFENWKVASTPFHVDVFQWVPKIPMQLPTNVAVANAVYHCYPTSGYFTDGFSTDDWAVLQIGYPLSLTSFECTVVNRSPINKKFRIYCSYPSSVGAARTYAAFRRGTYVNAIWSNSYIQPGQALRLVFHPASSGKFKRPNAQGVVVDVPGFDEFDVDTDEARTYLPVDNT